MKEKFFEILKYRELLASLVWKNVKLRYHGSVLGYFWSFLSPFLMMGLFTLVFSYFLRIQIDNYPLFLVSAIVPWSFFSTSLLQGSKSLVTHSEFIKKMYCPREIFPLSLILTNVVILMAGLIAIIPFMLYFRGTVGEGVIILPIVIFIHFLFILGLAMILSCINVFYRDVEHILDFLLLFWFYLTPVIYPVSMVPEQFHPLLYLNPMFHILSLYRDILYSGVIPSLEFFASSLTIGIAALVGGWKIFAAFEQLAAKEL
tara:strand:- start:805 stop:1581 length:777 start_codon:yes stop_codon:yes gene_type:complete